jgi:hypothetical protein
MSQMGFLICLSCGYLMFYVGFVFHHTFIGTYNENPQTLERGLEKILEKDYTYPISQVFLVGYATGVLIIFSILYLIWTSTLAWEYMWYALGYYKIDKKWVLQELPVPEGVTLKPWRDRKKRWLWF